MTETTTETTTETPEPTNTLAPETGAQSGSESSQTESAAPEPNGHDTDEAKKGGASERIRGLIAENKAITEYAEHWRRRALETAQPAPAQPQPAAPDAAPTLEQHGFDAAKWSAAYTQWAERQIDARATAKANEAVTARETKRAEQTALETWNTRLETYIAKNPAAADVIFNPTLNISPSVREVIQASEVGPELANYLGMNPLEATRISRMPGAQAAVALGRIEERLSKPVATPPPAPKPKQSSAPPPPTPGAGASAVTTDDMDLPLSEFKAKLFKRRG